MSSQELAVYQPQGVAQPPAPVDITKAMLWGAVVVGIGVMGYLIFRGPKDNPTKLVSKTLIAKGRGVTFELTDGREIHCAGAMMHDPSGRWWPSKSILIGPAKLRESNVEIEGDAKAYFGRSQGHVGRVNTPPKPLSGWIYVGDVEHVFYIRSGRRAGYYQHPFNKGLQSIIRGKQRVRLYRRGRFMRLELPHGASLDDRGFVWP